MVLIVDGDVEKMGALSCEGRDRPEEPGPQAVGIGRDPQRDAPLGLIRLGQRRQPRHQLLFEQAELFHMATEPLAPLGRGAGLPPDDQHRPHPLLELLDALRDGRRRDVQGLSCPFEATGANDERHGLQRRIIEHDASLA